MRVREAAWAALVPWTGVQDKPVWLENPDGIAISAVIGLQEILDELEGESGTSVAWADVTGKPTFGSAAFVSTSTLMPAFKARTLQVGSVNIVAAQQEYTVTYTETMDDVPKTQLQQYITDGSSEMFYAAIFDETADGFTFRLNAVPLATDGRFEYWSQVQSQP